MKVTHIANIDSLAQLSDKEKKQLKPVVEKFAFRTNTYYNTLIDWNDPADPLKTLIMPRVDELLEWGDLDASNEKSYQPVEGLEHKYSSTALLLVNDVCGAYCRFCFRKRLFQEDNNEVVRDVSNGIEYIMQHTEINNVLLSGGDPLMMSSRNLSEIMASIAEVPHVKTLRIGTKMIAFDPFRVLNDSSLIHLLSEFNKEKQVYIVTHFNHPRELTDHAARAISELRKNDITLINQTPIIRGVNDSSEVLTDLFNVLCGMGLPQYYVFACRPTAGNKSYILPLEESFKIFQDSRKKLSGLAKMPRFVMSHVSGKIEVVGFAGSSIVMKYHSATKAEDIDRVMIFERNPEAYWFDDYLQQS